jgi:hypothetical protein
MNKKLKKMDGFKIAIREIPCFLEIGYYSDGKPRIRVVEEDGSPYGVLTINIPEVDLEEDEILVKTWSENTPMADTILHSTGLFKDTGKRVPSGMVDAEIWKIL